MEAQKKELATTNQTASSTIDSVFGDFSSHGGSSSQPPPPATAQGLQTTGDGVWCNVKLVGSGGFADFEGAFGGSNPPQPAAGNLCWVGQRGPYDML